MRDLGKLGVRDCFRLAVSNIAWPRADHGRAVDILGELGVNGIELAPMQVFEGWTDQLLSDARRLRDDLERRGLAVPALQGWLFGVEKASLFKGLEAREAFAAHCRRVAELAGVLGAGACVYGAPKSRDPGAMAPEAAWHEAIDVLRFVAPYFEEQGTVLAFEANAARYDCRFVTTTDEAIRLVDDVSRKGVQLQIDTGTVILEDRDPAVIERAAPWAVHMHVSEPDLVPIGSIGSDHEALAEALRRSGYQGWISIEMRATEDWEARLRKAVALVQTTYMVDPLA